MSSNVNAVSRMAINDHSWVHIQIVTNIALKLLRQLTKHGVEPGLVRDFGLEQDDAEIVVVLAALFHCVGMSIHRHGHEDFSLFLSEPKMRQLLEGLYSEPDKTVIVSEALQAIISHRADGEPLTVDAGIVRVADALDMAKGRSRIPFEKGSISMHSLSAAAIEDVTITDGDDRPVKIEILMNNSSGIFQVDGLAEGEAARQRPRAVRRSRRAHRHRDRAATRADVPARDLRLTRKRPATLARDPLRGRLMVGRLTLDQEVGVRIPAPQLETQVAQRVVLRPRALADDRPRSRAGEPGRRAMLNPPGRVSRRVRPFATMGALVWTVKEGKENDFRGQLLQSGYRSPHPVREPSLGEVLVVEPFGD